MPLPLQILNCDQEGVEEEGAITPNLRRDTIVLVVTVTVWEFEMEVTVSTSDQGAMASIDLLLDRRKGT